MSDKEGTRGILLSHGSMASGLLDAVRKISGAGPEILIPVSNEGKSPEAVEEELSQIMGDSPMIIFTDLDSGSCAIAARRCLRPECQQAVICGVNLPVLLDFIFNRHLALEELVPRLVEKGLKALSASPSYKAHVDHPLSS